MTFFKRIYLDKEKDIPMDLFLENDALFYVLSTPNHHTGNLITNLAKLCDLPVSYDEKGLKVIRGQIPAYIDGYNRRMYIFRLGDTKVANIFPDGTVEMKAGIPSISKTLMSQTKDYRLPIAKTIIKTYILEDCKFRSDLHTHMNANLEPDVLIALGICHQIRYSLYYIKKLDLFLTEGQKQYLQEARKEAIRLYADDSLTGKYWDRRVDDHTFINFARLMLESPENAAKNIPRIRASLAILKDGQAVFTNLETVYLYRYVFAKGVPDAVPFSDIRPEAVPDEEIRAYLKQMLADHKTGAYCHNTLFQDKLLWIARQYRRHGIDYAEITDTTLVKPEGAAEMLRQVHDVLPKAEAETGVVIRFLAGIRRIPLTVIGQSRLPDTYLSESLRVLRAVCCDPYVAGADIIGEEINDIRELTPVIREMVRLAKDDPSFVVRIHAGENDSLPDNVAESLRIVRESLTPGQRLPHMRIGHGLYTTDLRSPRGRKLLADLAETHVVLEFQISSNVRLNNLSSMGIHPLKQYLAAGVRCVQGTDGSAIYGTDSIDEQLTLEKLLDLTHEEMLAMRRTEADVIRQSLSGFAEKSRRFEEERKVLSPEEYLRSRLSDSAASALTGNESLLLPPPGLRPTEELLGDLVEPLPSSGVPVILAGGSFNNDHHQTVMRPELRAVLDQLLALAGPSVFFVTGHKLTGYEQYLIRRNRGEHPVYVFVPAAITEREAEKIRRAGVKVRIAIESSGMGVYKSIAYEIFKRRPSVLLALDGNSAGANLMQEAKNGRCKCSIFVHSGARALRAKAEALQGYARLFRAGEPAASEILKAVAGQTDTIPEIPG